MMGEVEIFWPLLVIWFGSFMGASLANLVMILVAWATLRKLERGEEV